MPFDPFMKHLPAVFILLFSISISRFSFAQSPSGMPLPALSLSGQVLDKDAKIGVAYATVSILSAQEGTIINGAVADEKGNFKVTDLKPGRIRYVVSFIGYQTYQSDTIFISPRNPDKNVGQIFLQSASKQVKEVVVSGERSMMQMSIDKKVFNVEKTIVGEGGSATDILQNIPAVDVDMNGNISLRGSGNVTVLIDGKPSVLTGGDRAAILDQLPANTIESIELITNPSAKYDPDGTSGIINIILKKNKKESMSGSANVSVGVPNRYNAGLNLNYRDKKWNLSTGYSFRYNQMNMNSLNERRNIFTDTSFYSNQYGSNKNTGQNHVLRFAADRYLNDKNTIGTSATLSMNNRNSKGTSDNYQLDQNENLIRFIPRMNKEENTSYSMDLGLNYRRTFNRPKQELTSELSFSRSAISADNNYRQLRYDPAGNPEMLSQSTYNDGIVTLASFKVDYSYPLTETSRLETGVKSSYRDNDADFTDRGPYVLNPDQTNHFIFTEQINAAYVNYGRTFGNWGLQAGLRAEQANTLSDQRTGNIKVENDYFSLFPSLYLSRKLKKDQELQLNYSRRINRPNINNLNPFTDYSDPQNLRTGNPNLKPEYVDSYELSYVKYWKRSSLTSTTYLRQINDQIQRFRVVDTTGVSTVSFQNLSYARNYGFEFIAVTEVRKNWTVTSNLNIFRQQIDVSNLNGEIRTGTNMNFKLNSMTRIPKWFDLQVSGNYNAPGVTAQGETRAMYSMDAGLKRDVMKSKGTVTFNVSDIFDTREMRFDSYGATFSQYTRFKRQSRVATLGFTYRFGRTDFQQRRKGGREEAPAPSMDSEMMY